MITTHAGVEAGRPRAWASEGTMNWRTIAGLGLVGAGSWALWRALRPIVGLFKLYHNFSLWYLMLGIYRQRVGLAWRWASLAARAFQPGHTWQQRTAVLQAAWVLAPWRWRCFYRQPAPTL